MSTHSEAPLTVVIPTYKRPGYLKEAIASVLAQTYGDFQVLVVDNASPDDTRDVVGSFSDKRISYHRHETNIGPQRNWRFALTHPQTEFVALLEDDNLYLPHHLETAMAVLKAEPGASFYGCATESFGRDHVSLFTPWWLRESKNINFNAPRENFIACLQGALVAATSLLIRRRALDAIQIWGGSNWPASMDYLWEAQMMLAGGMVYNPQIGTKYRWHDENYYTSWRSKARYAASEFRWTIRTLANLGLEHRVLQVDELISQVLTWHQIPACTLVTALSAREADPALRRAAKVIFRDHPEITRHGGSGHTRLAHYVGSWYLGFADRMDRFLSHWPPAEAA